MIKYLCFLDKRKIAIDGQNASGMKNSILQILDERNTELIKLKLASKSITAKHKSNAERLLKSKLIK